MTDFELEQKNLLLSFLDIHYFSSWKTLPSTRGRNDYTNSLEMMISPICNTKCSYCYMKNYSDKLYPCSFDKGTLLKNCDTVMNWLYLNNYYPDSIDIFSGEFFNLPYWKEYLDIVYKYLEKMPEGNKVKVVIPTNSTFIFDDKKTQAIENYIENVRSKGLYIFLSMSVDGKYLDNDTRPLKNGKKYTDEFYDKLFAFGYKYRLAFHPMVGCKGIDKWSDNFDWFIDNIQKYYHVDRKHAADFIYLLEVRNPDWTDEELDYLRKFINHALDYIFEDCKNNDEKYEAFRKNKLNFFNSILGCVGRGLGCSFQSTIDIRMGDLALVPCHRTGYDELLAGYFHFKGATFDIDVKNVNSYIFGTSFDFAFTNQCNNCVISNLCSGPCLGCNYEVNKDMFTMVPSVCKLEFVKTVATVERLDNEGLLDRVIKNTSSPNKFKPKKRQIENIREYLRLQKEE